MENVQSRFTWANGGNSRSVAARLLRGTDLITGLLDVCKESGLRAAGIAVCMGSLRRAEFSWTGPSTRTKRGSDRTPPTVLEGPVELLGAQGTLGLSDPENPAYHVHGTICDSTGRVWGGHIYKGGQHRSLDDGGDPGGAA